MKTIERKKAACPKWALFVVVEHKCPVGWPTWFSSSNKTEHLISFVEKWGGVIKKIIE